MPEAVVFNNRKVKKLIRDKISKLGRLDKDSEVLLSKVVHEDIANHFYNEKGPRGKWKSWSPSYREYMSRIGKANNRILQDTRHMFNQFKPMDVRQTYEGLLWYNNAKTKNGFPYAYAHNTGGPKLPKRQFMWLSRSALDKAINILLKHLARK